MGGIGRLLDGTPPTFFSERYENNTIHKTDCRGVDTFPRLPSINEGGL